MIRNVGNTDRAFRVTGGVIVMLLGLYYQSWWGLLGFIPVITGLIRFCPAYYPFGISTNKTEPKKAEKVL